MWEISAIIYLVFLELGGQVDLIYALYLPRQPNSLSNAIVLGNILCIQLGWDFQAKCKPASLCLAVLQQSFSRKECHNPLIATQWEIHYITQSVEQLLL